MTATSGQVTGAGTKRLGSLNVQSPIAMKALIGNVGTISITNYPPGGAGFKYVELAPGDVFIFDYVSTLHFVWYNSDNPGDGVCWLSLNV